MKKQVFGLVLVLVLGVFGGGCAWWSQLKSDPVTALSEGTNYIRTGLSLARVAFDIWAAADPNGAAAPRNTFNTIVGNVERGLQVAQSGLRTAAVARGPAPDTEALLREAQTAMRDLNAFLSGLPSRGDGRAVDPTMRAALQATLEASRPF